MDDEHSADDQKNAKAELAERLALLNKELDTYLARTYGIYAEHKPVEFAEWKQTHQPFHWFAEFYQIIALNGGFDVVIGNPPYVVYTKKAVSDIYSIKDYNTINANNLYAFTIERALNLTTNSSRLGMIIPISSVSNANFIDLQNIFCSKTLAWFSSYSNRPGKLFDGVEQRLTIFVLQKQQNKNKEYFTSSYKHWYANTRDALFSSLLYAQNSLATNEICFSKVGSMLEKKIKDGLLAKSNIKLSDFANIESKYFTYYHNGPTYFIRAMSFMPNSGKDMQPSSHYKKIVYHSNLNNAVACILNSSLFYFFYKNYSNCRDFSEREINAFPIGDFSESELKALENIEIRLRKSYTNNKAIKIVCMKAG